MEQIKENLKKAIECFDFKQKFAKNKEWHNKNVNYLVEAYNYIDLHHSFKTNRLLTALIYHLFFSNLEKYKNQDIAMKQTIDFIKNPNYQISFFYGFIKNEILSSKIETALKTNNINTKEIFDTSEAKTVMKEILQLAKTAI